MSIASFIIIAFVMVSTLFLAVFGVIDYRLEKNRQWNNLSKELASAADELQLSLALPAWNFDYAQIESIIESSMSNQNIFGMIISVGDEHLMRARGADWQIIMPAKDFSHDKLLLEKRDIISFGQNIGMIKLFGSTRLMEENLRATFISIMSFISIFVSFIIIGLYLVLHKVVLKPVMDIEQYTRSVSSGNGKGLRIKGSYFQGELATLRSSLRKMVATHEERFIELQNEVKRRIESEDKYRNIFERSVEGIFQSTAAGKFLSVNPAMARQFGYDSPDEMIRSVKDISTDLYKDPGERLRFQKHLERFGIVEGFETRFYKKDKKILWGSVNARSVCDVNGDLLYYEGAIMDITMRKNSEEEREHLEAQLRQAQKIEAIGTMAGGIAHDFNNILTVISGYASLLQTELSPDNSLQKCANQILAASEKAMSLTKGLLAFSRKQAVQLNPVNLNEIINGIEKILGRLLTEDITLQKNLSNEDIVIMGDITQIDQILFNLSSNARDAMPGGGRLTIETRLIDITEKYKDMPGYMEPGTYALLTVSDTGHGIDEKTREHIFDPFFTTKDVNKGTGLGLSTVYGVVKQHKGYINVYSEPGIGTAFHIYFPVVLADIKDTAIESPAPSGGNETILIAEDNEGVRDLMRTILTKAGYTVIEAEDGEEAVRKYRAHDNMIDLIILDSVMPKKNGREVYEEIRGYNPGIRTIFTSGYTRDVILDKGIEEKEVEFISKPLTPNDLLKKVREVLDVHA